jgi:GH15 family glucan-1,4-alpha-glucosidase
VGQENHIGGQFFRLGVWVNNQFSWVGQDWKRDQRYMPDRLITQVSLYHEGFGLLIFCKDAVDFHENIYLREITLENLTPRAREVRLFLTQDFNISGNDVGDTAALDPVSGAIVHYKGARYFLIDGFAVPGKGFSQFAVGQKGIGGREGTYKDAEDGILSGNPIAQGSVDSVIGLTLQLGGLGKEKAYYWITAGQTWGRSGVWILWSKRGGRNSCSSAPVITGSSGSVKRRHPWSSCRSRSANCTDVAC